MADTYSSYIEPHRLGSSQLVSPNHENPNKFHTHFMYKAILTAIFLVILPLLPPQPPQFIDQTLHTRSWELFQLLVVGIAVSYGLFSRRNDETEKEHSSKSDNVNLFMSKFLQISSVFDDETDSLYGYHDNKVQTWNSQYYRGEPVVVVAQESSVLEEQSGDSARFGEKPLLLPIRSLKSRVSDAEFAEATNESSGRAGSNSGSKRFSNNSKKSRNVGFGASSPLDLEEKLEENKILCSPILWGSKSERMEIKQEMDHDVPLFSLPPSMEDSEFSHLESHSFRPQISQSSTPNFTFTSPSLSSPENPSNFPSFSTESQAKIVEKVPRKKIQYKHSPPPLPPIVCKSPLVKPNFSPSNSDNFPGKELKRKIWSVPKHLSGYDTEQLLSRACETDQDSESEDYVFEEEEEDSGNEEVASNSVRDEGPDVNKKADEFIAKFREQIRIQRTESIKRSTGLIARNSSRLLA
ncbi:unnamed protein product [Camellia sinensis]